MEWPKATNVVVQGAGTPETLLTSECLVELRARRFPGSAQLQEEARRKRGGVGLLSLFFLFFFFFSICKLILARS